MQVVKGLQDAFKKAKLGKGKVTTHASFKYPERSSEI